MTRSGTLSQSELASSTRLSPPLTESCPEVSGQPIEPIEAQLRLALSGSDKTAPADGVCFFSYAHFRNGGNGDRPTVDDLRRVLVSGKAGADAKPPFAQPVPQPLVSRLQQPSEGTLAGFATDAAGGPLDSQIVKVSSMGAETALEVKTDGNGFYAAVFLKPGRYRVRIPGDVKETVIEVTAGRVVRLGQSP